LTPKSGIRDGEKIRVRDEHPSDHFPERNSLRLKILEFFDEDPGSGIFLTLDLGVVLEKFGSATLAFSLL
jgi:hypothetical protein